ncbi:hypothetical protein [uncultured Flavonifractor sp.]|uniref:hypothetical protein n=1 Tax=uncultured Flavonifractor sp. TaxID=1193534 RepID=UPI0026207CE1|nr:hypothetical protein [uncultured Flavonifractor sp.]
MMDNTNLKSRMGTKLQAIAGQESIHLPADPGSDYLALTHNAMDIIKENLKHQPLPFQLFDLMKSPSGGSTVFSVPGLSGEEAEKELTGIILDYTTPRAYWDTPDPVEGTPPTCMSKNSLISEDRKPCAHCPFNDYGSKDGESNAKACKESVLLFLLRPDSIFPLLVRVPVTSKMLFLKYTTRLVSRLTPLSSVVTRITLEKATSRAGKPYALFQFDAVSVLCPEEAARARAFGQQFMEIANAAEIEPVFTQAG